MYFAKIKEYFVRGDQFVKHSHKHYDFLVAREIRSQMNARTVDTPPKDSVRILLNEIIDYAGLFPPSQVSMADAVLNYATYKGSNYGWMLGRFILPVARLDEFYESAREFLPRRGGNPWRVSSLAGEDVAATIRSINEFNRKHSDRVICDVLEVKANTVSKIENTMTSLPKAKTPYFEIAVGGDLIATLGIKKLRAKIRTGGVTREEFPATRDIVRFVRTCMAANVPFKATAGLHHPIRCFKPLTYAEDAPQGEFSCQPPRRDHGRRIRGSIRVRRRRCVLAGFSHLVARTYRAASH
jgi:hypothetical protein